MKILHIITSLKTGGAESALYLLLKHFQEHKSYSNTKHEVIYFHHGSNVEQIKSLGIKTHHIRGFKSPYDPLSLYRLFKLIKKTKPDIIHSSLWSANIIARIIGKLLNIPVVCDIHGEFIQHGKARNIIERAVSTFPATFVPVSQSIKRSLPKYFAHKKVHVIQNGIDIKRLQKNTSKTLITKLILGLNCNTFVVGTVGRLASVKRYEFLIKAFHVFSNNRNVKLIFIGDGPERNKLERLVNSHNLTTKVMFLGMQNNPHRFYPAFDCFALTSKTEGLSIALLEAMAYGLPAICTNTSKDHDVISHGKNGFLVSQNNLQKFVAYLIILYENKILRNSLGNAGRALIQEQFTIDRTTKQYHYLYSNLAEQKSGNK